MEIIKNIGRALLVTFGIIRKPELIARKVSDHPVPETIEPGYLYLVGGSDYVKWAYFRCPSDESELIQLSLMTKRHPSWQVTIDVLGRPTLHPSVRPSVNSTAAMLISGLRAGNIEWCANSGNIPRYVDTFEPKAETDVAALQKHINEIETGLVDVRKRMAGYLKELGL